MTRALVLQQEVTATLACTEPDRGLIRALAMTVAVAEERACVAGRLREGADLPSATAADLCEQLACLTELQGRLLEHTVTLRLTSLADIHAALARLGSCMTVAELLPAAVAELAACGGFDRAAISRLRGSTWRSEAVWLSPSLEPAAARQMEEYVTTHWIPVGAQSVETDLIRRRAAAVVTAADLTTRSEWLDATDTGSYVASPVMPDGRVIGFLHADCYLSGRPLTGHDRDLLWTFAEGFGLLFQRTVLLERLDQQRQRAREAFASAEKQLADLADDEIRLVHTDAEPRVIAQRAVEVFRTSRAPLAPDDGLTSRERDVVELMATGARNVEIADRLVVSEATVKSHVRSVMRKLGASNRADVVARYLIARKESTP